MKRKGPESSIRLTATSYGVLALLEMLGEATSYDLKRALTHSIENFWPIPHTTFYEEPARLARAGLLTARQEAHGRRRRIYALTDAGRRALHDWADDPTATPPQTRDDGLLKIFAGANPGPLLRARCDWHRDKLAELEGYLAAMRARQRTRTSPSSSQEQLWRGVELSLRAGIGYHRQLLALTEELAAESRRPARSRS
ncbi:MAG: helix-turn-helix transcriptional regulator [Acidobacteriota bacterium]|nr:helix-turn-helix transcriptional regulator [Acidobacteriota bacterium]